MRFCKCCCKCRLSIPKLHLVNLVPKFNRLNIPTAENQAAQNSSGELQRPPIHSKWEAVPSAPGHREVRPMSLAPRAALLLRRLPLQAHRRFLLHCSSSSPGAAALLPFAKLWLGRPSSRHIRQGEGVKQGNGLRLEPCFVLFGFAAGTHMTCNASSALTSRSACWFT